MTIHAKTINPICQISHHPLCDGGTFTPSVTCACICHVKEDNTFFDRAMSKVMTDLALLLWRSNRAKKMSKQAVLAVVIDAMRESAGRHPGWNKEAAMQEAIWEILQFENWDRDRALTSIKAAVMIDA